MDVFVKDCNKGGPQNAEQHEKLKWTWEDLIVKFDPVKTGVAATK